MTPRLEGVRLVTWDVDGTLYDAARLRAVLRRRALRLQHLGALWAVLSTQRAVKAQRSGDGRVLADVRATSLPRLEAQDAFLAEQLRTIGARREALALLEAVRGAGIAQAALSDFPCRRKIAALGLDRYFERRHDAASLGFWKPSRALFAEVERLHGVTPGEHLHVGDRDDTDGAGARAVGCAFHLL
ncbi:MAG: HAD family hydrolase [Myxococcaceae bacterium]|nr:HAD family hydrolase [Myxococcaceae bacterium]